MNKFTISRLNSEQGIFKITGLFKPEISPLFTIEITSIEMMSTDGWVVLDRKNNATMNLIKKLHSDINDFLQATNVNSFF